MIFSFDIFFYKNPLSFDFAIDNQGKLTHFYNIRNIPYSS